MGQERRAGGPSVVTKANLAYATREEKLLNVVAFKKKYGRFGSSSEEPHSEEQSGT